MKNEINKIELSVLESELEQIAPWVHQGFTLWGGPSAEIEASIRTKALEKNRRHTHFRGWSWQRTLAVAASLMLLFGAFTHLHLTHQKNRNKQIADFAGLLLEIQGLNEESYFTANEVESLLL